MNGTPATAAATASKELRPSPSMTGGEAGSALGRLLRGLQLLGDLVLRVVAVAVEALLEHRDRLVRAAGPVQCEALLEQRVAAGIELLRGAARVQRLLGQRQGLRVVAGATRVVAGELQLTSLAEIDAAG